MATIKKSILLALTALMMATSCNNDTINGIQLNKGDTKTYETKDYLIIYEIERFNIFGQSRWKFKEIINKKDSLKESNHERTINRRKSQTL